MKVPSAGFGFLLGTRHSVLSAALWPPRHSCLCQPLGGHLSVLSKPGEPLIGVELGRRDGDRLEHDATFFDGDSKSVPAAEP